MRKTLRFPYVCNGYNLKYSCHKKQYKYGIKRAQEFADHKLIVSRHGINLTKQEFEVLNNKIYDGLANGNFIYHIVVSNDDISSSVSTVYRYINAGYLKTKKIDLPYACTYKKRKKSNKKTNIAKTLRFIALIALSLTICLTVEDTKIYILCRWIF